MIDADTAEAAIRPTVRVSNGRALADSRDVAAFFGRRHANVVRAIRVLIAAEPGLSHLNFELAEYIDDHGKPRSKFDMDRDGFALLATRFIGPAALRLKLAYIDAFNRMEMTLEAKNGDGALDHRDFPDWPLEELRTKKATADLYRQVYGPLSAQWIMPQLGFPAPPRQLVELGRQMGLALEGLPPHPMSGATEVNQGPK